MRTSSVVALLLLAACSDPAAEKARAEAKARSAIDATSAQASTVAAAPVLAGLWDEPHVVERLVRAGLAPQALPQEKGERQFKTPGHVYQLGKLRLTVYIYQDSVARRAITASIDTASIGPKPVQGQEPVLHQLVIQNNLAAILIGGSERQQERVSLALSAGLPVSP